ncbi:MAG: hypothetical protein K9H16_07495 [Bacteroidales bacterium]|nr:hypothetical protein [Bacteroidales bacterium]
MSSSNKFVISKLLDDLTHLEINTIIKKGMTSAPQPEEIEEVLSVLLSDYKERLGIIHNRNNIEKKIDVDSVKSYKKLYEVLHDLSTYMDSEKIWLDDGDFMIFLRMKSFCKYLESRAKDIKFSQRNGIDDTSDIYSVDMNEFSKFKLDMNSRDRVMIKRLYDLGTERIVMQTRIGIDGDVITRIEENFANKPRQVVLDLHEKHTDLSVKYWQSLINVVKDLVSGIIR